MKKRFRIDGRSGPTRYTRVRRRGFTLIEILVVIAIIAVLAGMLFVGGKAIAGHSRAKATRVTLHNLRGMYAELENARGARFYEAIYPPANTGKAASIVAPADVTPDSYLSNKPDRHGDAVQNTASIMAMVQSIPSSKDTIARLPTNQLLPASATVGAESHTDKTNPPVLLDAWGNPIIYVPPGGMDKVKVTVGGTMQANLKIAPDNKGYFASAGPDGNFASGDDNLYSFED